MFFFCLRHLGKAKAKNLKRRLGCDKFISRESDGCSGGLLMLWHRNVVVKKLNVSQYYIDVVVGGGEWRLTGIYGEPSWDQKDQTWEAPHFLKNRSMNSLP
jgi:hypothetical protein